MNAWDWVPILFWALFEISKCRPNWDFWTHYLLQKYLRKCKKMHGDVPKILLWEMWESKKWKVWKMCVPNCLNQKKNLEMCFKYFEILKLWNLESWEVWNAEMLKLWTFELFKNTNCRNFQNLKFWSFQTFRPRNCWGFWNIAT